MGAIKVCDVCKNAHWGDVCPACNPPEDIRSKLVKIASGLLVNRMSEHVEDYPKSMPVSVIEEIKNHNNLLRLYSIQISDILKNH